MAAASSCSLYFTGDRFVGDTARVVLDSYGGESGNEPVVW